MSSFNLNTEKYRPEKTPNFDILYAMDRIWKSPFFAIFKLNFQMNITWNLWTESKFFI